MADKEQAELPKEKAIKKSIKNRTIDMNGGKVEFFTEGYADGDKIKVNVNGKDAEVVVTDNHGVYASGWTFKDFPAVILK